jgi:hypothetical protein
MPYLKLLRNIGEPKPKYNVTILHHLSYILIQQTLIHKNNLNEKNTNYITNNLNHIFLWPK